MRLVASTASAFCAATAASMLSRVSGFFSVTTSQLGIATVDSLLILEARRRSNGHRRSTSGVIATTKTRENVCLWDALSAHSLLTDVLIAATQSHAAPRSKRVCTTRGRVTRCSRETLVCTQDSSFRGESPERGELIAVYSTATFSGRSRS